MYIPIYICQCDIYICIYLYIYANVTSFAYKKQLCTLCCTLQTCVTTLEHNLELLAYGLHLGSLCLKCFVGLSGLVFKLAYTCA